MVLEKHKSVLPRTLAEYLEWEAPVDGYKYEWNDGELIKSKKMNRKHLSLLSVLTELFDKTRAKKNRGLFLTEQSVQLTGIQVRIPDLAYFSREQVVKSKDKNEDEPIPEFVIEVVSKTDDAEKNEQKLIEYFKTGVRVAWFIFLENKSVYVYTSRKTVKICTDDDICSASPVLDDFEISVNDLFI